MLYGIRFDGRDFCEGDEIPKSHRWEDGYETEELLSGTSSIYVGSDMDEVEEKLESTLEEYKDLYSFGHAYLVCIEDHWGHEWGEDDGEIILNGPEVVKKLY